MPAKSTANTSKANATATRAAAAEARVTVVGIDIGKTTFHMIGLDARGKIARRLKLSRGQVEARLANMSFTSACDPETGEAPRNPT